MTPGPEKINLLSYGTGDTPEETFHENPYELDTATVTAVSPDLPRGGAGPQGGGSPELPRPKRVLGWTSAEGVKGILRYASNPTKRTPIGIWQIDNLIGGGVGRGEVCVIIGKSGSGKSILGQNILEANLEVPAVFFSFEMPGTMLVTRSLAMWSGKSHNEIFNSIERNQLDNEMLANWDDAHKNHLYVTRTGLDLAAMSQALKEAEEAFGEKPAIVVIDYMELVASASGSGETIDNVTNIAQLLKGWAKQEEVSCVVLHQTNKSLRHGDAPDEDAARYGGFTEADVVIGVWRPHKWEPSNKNDSAMREATRDYLKGFYGVNLIKNRPKIDLHEKGYLVPILPSGRIDAPKGKTLEDVPMPGTGPF
jgi:KaiC/GvpD/RAD55 family RecA-like ATPase